MHKLEGLPKLSENENCYLLSLQPDGDFDIRPAYVKETDWFSSSINRVQKVSFGDTTGFKKDSRNQDDSDDLEIVINWIGQKLGVSMANTYRYLTQDGVPEAVISENVISSDEEEFVTMRDVRNDIAKQIAGEQLSREPWIGHYMKLLEQKAYPEREDAFENIAYTEEQAVEIIEVGRRLIALLPSNSSDKKQIVQQYEKMIFLDTLVGQVDRTLNNYGYIHNKNTNRYSFSPLFDNATLRKPYSGVNTCMINNFIIERSHVFNILLKNKAVYEIATRFIKAKYSFIRVLDRICIKMLDSEKHDILMHNILMGIMLIEEILSVP